EPVSHLGRHARYGKYQPTERGLCRVSDTRVANRPARLMPGRGLDGLTVSDRLDPGIDDDRLRLHGFLVDIDLKPKGGKGLSSLGNRLAIRKQTQHAEIEFSVNGFTFALH